MTKTGRTIVIATVILWLASGTVVGQRFEFSYKSRESVTQALPPIPATGVQLVLDDDTSDGDFGVNTPNAQQFMWFNQFTSPVGGSSLDQIWVLFPPGAAAPGSSTPTPPAAYRSRTGRCARSSWTRRAPGAGRYVAINRSGHQETGAKSPPYPGTHHV